MSVGLAFASAFAFGVGVTLQQRAAVAVPVEQSLRVGLLRRLLRRPLWLAGGLAEIIGFGLQAAALARGSLVVVQPILTLDVLFTLALISIWTRVPLQRREWVGVLCTVVGVATFLVATASDQDSASAASRGDWLAWTAGVGVVIGLAVGFASRRAGVARAGALAVAAGAANGFMAVLTKTFAEKLDDGIGETLVSWPVYGVIAAGLVTVLLVQSTYQAGHPNLALPVMNVADPTVSVAIGVGLFGETLARGAGASALALLALLVVGVGVVALARAPRAAPEPREGPARRTVTHELT